jgi:preprotein translocase subunit YajC
MKKRTNWKKVCYTNSKKIVSLVNGIHALITSITETDEISLARESFLKITENDLLRVVNNLEKGICV